MSKSHQKKHNQAVKTSHPQEKHAKQTAQVKQVKKERGGLLTSIYIFIILHGALAAYMVYASFKPAYGVDRTWAVVAMVVSALLNVVAGFGMWNWKKWGIMLYGVSAVIASVIGLVFTGSMLVIFYQLIPFAILIYILTLKDKRQFFE
jgi:cation transport ATPase